MNGFEMNKAKVVVVDDEKANVRLLELILSGAGYENVYSTTDARSVLALCEKIQPDILLLDLAMPYVNGYEIIRSLRKVSFGSHLPILVLTADVTSAAKHKALEEGANDFLTKPLDEKEVLLRIHNLLQSHFYSALLELKVRERTHELEQSQLETLQKLALAAEYRDDDTGLHTRRVGVTSGRIATILNVPSQQVELLIRAAPLHDVGKIGVSDTILLKPGKLTEDEFELIKTHTVIGAKILSGSTSPWLSMAEEIAMTHHERWDGKGYPNGLTGEAIPLVGRIVSVADVFDALTHERPYKNAWSVPDALKEIESKSGSQFDKAVVDAFLQIDHSELI